MDCLGRVENSPVGGDAKIQLEQAIVERSAVPDEGDDPEQGNENHHRIEEE